jgi:hypothetical protein
MATRQGVMVTKTRGTGPGGTWAVSTNGRKATAKIAGVDSEPSQFPLFIARASGGPAW